MSQFTDFITLHLQRVSDLTLEQSGKVTGITTKAGDNNQVLTQTDLAVGQRLIEAIQATYPDYNIIDEEAGVIDKKSRFTWVVDPIDGTSNFANGLPTYGIMIGLLEDATPIAGGISLPAFNQILVAEKGKGTTCNGERVTVTHETELLKALVAYGIDGHQADPAQTYAECRTLAEIVLRIRNLRSSNSAFDIAQVAIGRYGAMLNQSSKIWDNVAQHIIIEEAGGIYTDFYGLPMEYSEPLNRAEQNFTFCAASPALHAQLQTAIHS